MFISVLTVDKRQYAGNINRILHEPYSMNVAIGADIRQLLVTDISIVAELVALAIFHACCYQC